VNSTYDNVFNLLRVTGSQCPIMNIRDLHIVSVSRENKYNTRRLYIIWVGGNVVHYTLNSLSKNAITLNADK